MLSIPAPQLQHAAASTDSTLGAATLRSSPSRATRPVPPKPLRSVPSVQAASIRLRRSAAHPQAASHLHHTGSREGSARRPAHPLGPRVNLQQRASRTLPLPLPFGPRHALLGALSAQGQGAAGQLGRQCYVCRNPEGALGGAQVDRSTANDGPLQGDEGEGRAVWRLAVVQEDVQVSADGECC